MSVYKKKKEQLGMNPGTASYHLFKDVFWMMLQETNRGTCCKCGKLMTRESFSIEHLEPWLDSVDPTKIFFDLENIGFSHLKCNVESARPRSKTAKCGSAWKYRSGCRCAVCLESRAKSKRDYYARKSKSRDAEFSSVV